MQIRCFARFSLMLSIILSGAYCVWSAEPNQLSEEEKAGGWKLLFDGKTTHGWHSFKKDTFPAKGWDIGNGWLHGLGRGGGDIISDGEYEQFEIQWEWKQAPAGNSGLKYFVLETRSSPLGHEYQIIDDEREPDSAHAKRITAAFYDVLKPTTKPPVKPAGQTNESKVVVSGNRVEHWLNGVKVLEYSCGSEAVKEAVAQSKFKNVAAFGNRVKGHILLQEHGSEIWFRNLKIRELPTSGKS
jgi:hypothetical protein